MPESIKKPPDIGYHETKDNRNVGWNVRKGDVVEIDLTMAAVEPKRFRAEVLNREEIELLQDQLPDPEALYVRQADPKGEDLRVVDIKYRNLETGEEGTCDSSFVSQILEKAK